MDRNKAQAILSTKKPWVDNGNAIWLATTLKLYRNIEKFSFPAKLGADKRRQISSLVSKNLLELENLKSPLLIKAEDVQPLEKEYLLEHFLAMQGFHEAHSNEAFIIDQTGEFLSVLNIRDHIQLQITDCGGEIENSWNRLVAIESALGASVNYGYSPQFGFLTSDPHLCGTGLVAHAFLHLPGLIHSGQLVPTLQKVLGEQIATTGLQGDPLNLIGDVVVLHNTYTLGLTEEDILSAIRAGLTKLIVAEKSARAQIKMKDSVSIKDRVSRAYGLLLHSYQIETIEAMNALSLLKLGLDLEWLEGIDNQHLNDLFFNCRRAHLTAQFKEQFDPQRLAHKRSELIHEALKSAILHV